MFVLFFVTFIDSTVHQFYFFWTGRYLTSIGIPGNWVMPAMSVGQFAEIGTMAVLGVFLKKLGWRWTMTIGILGHAARFAVFALFPDPGLAVGVNVLHGICYAFFFATVYIFVDEFFPKDARSSAQGLFNLLILGVGPLVGNYVGPILGTYFTKADGAIDFGRMFLIPSFAALAGAVILAVFFHPPEKAIPEKGKPAPAH
jgi:MFS family permease